MQKLIGAIILEKILKKLLDKDTIFTVTNYLKNADKGHVLSKVFKYIKYFVILFVLSGIILFATIIYLIYYIFTHFI